MIVLQSLWTGVAELPAINQKSATGMSSPGGEETGEGELSRRSGHPPALNKVGRVSPLTAAVHTGWRFILSKSLCLCASVAKNRVLWESAVNRKGRNCKTNPIFNSNRYPSMRNEEKIFDFMISETHHPSERAYGGNFPFKVSQGHSRLLKAIQAYSRGFGKKYFLFSRTTPSTLQLSTFTTLALLPVVQSSTRKLMRPIRPIPTYWELFRTPSPPTPGGRMEFGWPIKFGQAAFRKKLCVFRSVSLCLCGYSQKTSLAKSRPVGRVN
jgi:hypothetical protein